MAAQMEWMLEQQRGKPTQEAALQARGLSDASGPAGCHHCWVLAARWLTAALGWLWQYAVI